MEGLSEDQKQALAEAKATARSAQAIIDELEQIARAARREEFRRLRTVSRCTDTLKITLLPPADRQDYPKPASRMLPKPSTSISVILRGHPPLPEPDCVRETYRLVKSFHGFAATHSLPRNRAIKALKQAGIDIYEEVARDWDNEVPIRELSRRHGPGRDTIARWIRKTGREIKSGNSNREYDEALIVATYKKTRSANRAAQAAGISWATARSALRRHDLWIEEG